MKLDEFTSEYIETALWISTDDEGNPLDNRFDADDIALATLKQMKEDCEAFQRDHADDVAADPGRAGHDFWLTRNRYGAGFWDGAWEPEVGKRLTEASHAYGSVNLYIHEGKVHG